MLDEYPKNAYFGFDFGGVITDFLQGRHPSEIGDAYLDVLPYPLAFTGVGVMVQELQGRVFCVSYSGAEVEAMTRRWLDHHDFYGQTGFQPDMLTFVRDWRYKTGAAMELTGGNALGFVDDKLPILRRMRSALRDLVLFGKQPPGQVVPDEVLPAEDWAHVLRQFGYTS